MTTSPGRVEPVLLEKIRLDGGTQPRQAIDNAVVAEYAEVMSAGIVLPPGEAYFDGIDYWLWDGFHRFLAARRRGADRLRLNVCNGTRDDARWASLGANKGHGLRRTNADKQHAVAEALNSRPGLSDRLIAEHVGVSDKTVAEARKRLSDSDRPAPTAGIPQSPRTGKDGRTINTANIGRRPAAPAPAPEPAPETGPEAPPDDRSRRCVAASFALDALAAELDELGLYERHAPALDAVRADLVSTEG